MQAKAPLTDFIRMKSSGALFAFWEGGAKLGPYSIPDRDVVERRHRYRYKYDEVGHQPFFFNECGRRIPCAAH